MRNPEKKARMTKRVGAVGSMPDAVPFVFRDGETGAVKASAYLEVADTDPKRRAGLSKRASLPPDGGMLFENCAGPFWMKDTEFPLDLVYLDGDGTITEKTAMAVEPDGETLYPAHTTGVAHAVELPLGFCHRNGIRVGDTVFPFGMKPEDM